ncbi:MAG: RNA polymerase sigma factor RpoD/SigA [Gemmatimonadota bacterium]
MASAFDRYLKEISAEPLLNQEDEQALAQRIREGDEAAVQQLVRANLRFVVAVAKRYQKRGLPLSDLVNEGNLGLLRAARRFDEGRGVRFISYAVFWIRQAILQALADRGGVRGAADQPLQYMSLETPVWESQETCLQDVVADEKAVGPEERAQRHALRDALDSSLTGLPEREERIVRLYFGLDDGEPLTLGEISSRLRISRERARQLKERALARLRLGGRSDKLKGHYR